MVTITGSLSAWKLKVVDSAPSNVTKGTLTSSDVLCECGVRNGSIGLDRTSGNKMVAMK